MFAKAITLFFTLLLVLATFPQAEGVADCRMMTPGENPNLEDAQDLLVKFITVCRHDPPSLPAMSDKCYPDLSYKTAVMRICPPEKKDRRLWSTPVVYSCDDIFATVGSIIEQCHTVVSTGGRMNLESAQYGFIVVTRPGGPN